MQLFALHQRMRESNAPSGLLPRPCTTQMLPGARAVREYHGLAVGAQEHFARPGEMLRGDAQQDGLIRRDARQAAAHCKAGAALLDALRQRAVIAQPGREIGCASRRRAMPK